MGTKKSNEKGSKKGSKKTSKRWNRGWSKKPSKTSGFARDDSGSWSAEHMRNHLRNGTMGDVFYKTIHDWNDASLQDALRRANEALKRAGIPPSGNLCPIRFDKGTGQLTEGARKRLCAEADILTQADGLFLLPHERQRTNPPHWFDERMILTGRQQGTLCDFPTITQKFFQYARGVDKGEIKKQVKREPAPSPELSSQERHPEDAVRTHKMPKKRKRSSHIEDEATEQPMSAQPGVPHHSLHVQADSDEHAISRLRPNKNAARTQKRPKKRKRSSPAENGATELPMSAQTEITNHSLHGQTDSNEYTLSTSPLDDAVVHIGWVLQQDDGSFILEKGFRSLRTWFTNPESRRYDYEELKQSLRVTAESGLQVFWFESLLREPWMASDHHVIAGAIARMQQTSEICFFVAADVEHVRALSVAQRAIENQISQIVTLNLSAVDGVLRSEKAPRDTIGRGITLGAIHVRQTTKTPFPIPGISVSLARILGE